MIWKRIILEKCTLELPDYEVPSYVEVVSKMPYTKNNKYNFIELENIGNQIVENNVKKILK